MATGKSTAETAETVESFESVKSVTASARYPLPGKVTLATVGICALLCILDSSCLLPHPASAIALPDGLRPEPPTGVPAAQVHEAGESAGASTVGLPGWKVRRNYHNKLKALAKTLTTLASFKRGAPCTLAALAVHEREAARVQARLQGSAAMHVVLQLRDVWAYQSFDPFSLQKMKSKTRGKLVKRSPDSQPSDEAVCSGLVDSSTRSNEAWDAAAEAAESRQSGYVWETIFVYLYLTFALVALAYGVEAARWFLRRRKQSKDA